MVKNNKTYKITLRDYYETLGGDDNKELSYKILLALVDEKYNILINNDKVNVSDFFIPIYYGEDNLVDDIGLTHAGIIYLNFSLAMLNDKITREVLFAGMAKLLAN